MCLLNSPLVTIIITNASIGYSGIQVFEHSGIRIKRDKERRRH